MTNMLSFVHVIWKRTASSLSYDFAHTWMHDGLEWHLYKAVKIKGYFLFCCLLVRFLSLEGYQTGKDYVT